MTDSTPGGLAGKTIAFVGKVGYRDGWRQWFAELVAAAGGRVVGATEAPDFVYVGEGRGGTPPKELAALVGRHPAVVPLDLPAFGPLVLPFRPADLLREIAVGRRPDSDRFWDRFWDVGHRLKAAVDLSGADLRGADLYAAKLQYVTLDGADLRGAAAEYTEFGHLRRANLDGCRGPTVHLRDLFDCTLRGAELPRAWLFWGDGTRVERCDFTGATLTAARARQGVFADCTFADADLSDAELGTTTFVAPDFRGAKLARVHAAGAKFVRANLADAVLTRADLRGASLVGADLRGADLRDAVLAGADLTDTRVAGADFAGAVLTDAVLDADFSAAVNYEPPVVREPGPAVCALAAAAAGARQFETVAEVDLPDGSFAWLEVRAGNKSRGPYTEAVSRSVRGHEETFDRLPAPTVAAGLLNLADRWPNSTLRLDRVRASGGRSARGARLRELAVAAWAEACGMAAGVLARVEEAQRAEALRVRDELAARVRAKGAAVWNALDFRERRRFDLRGVDLSGADLGGAYLDFSADLSGARLGRASLIGARLTGAALERADLRGADLQCASLVCAKCALASFVGANLAHADLTAADLDGADLTGANLYEARLEKARFTEITRLPAGFVPPPGMVWKGDGPRPGA